MRRRRSSPVRSGWRGSWGLPGHVARNGWGRSHSLRILGESVRREAPHPFASGRRCPSPGRSTGTRPRWSCSSRGSARVPAAASSRPMCSNPLRSSRSAFCERPHGRTGSRGRRVSLPVLVEIHQLVLRGRARGHVGGPTGRPRSGCRPTAVPGPACPWACGSRRAWWCVVGPRRSPGGAGSRGLGAPRVAWSWASPVTWRETARVDPNRCGSSAQESGARRRTPSPRVGVAPYPDGPPGRGGGGRDRRRGLLRVPAAASSRPDVLEPAPLSRSAFCERPHGVLSA